MPKHKIKRQEEIGTQDWKQILKLAKELDFSQAYTVPKLQHWFSAVLAIIWLTGKRVNEVLQLRRKHIRITENQIRIKFFVGKKRSRKSPIEQMPYQKARTIKHKATPYILEYLQEFDEAIPDKESRLFPANTKPRTRVVNTTFINGQGEEETRRYKYQDQGGYVYPENARFWLSKINEQLPESKRIYFHYGRHSIGIKMAYQGRTAIQIAEVLDETQRAALEYTKHAGGLAQEWTNETE